MSKRLHKVSLRELETATILYSGNLSSIISLSPGTGKRYYPKSKVRYFFENIQSRSYTESKKIFCTWLFITGSLFRKVKPGEKTGHENSI